MKARGRWQGAFQQASKAKLGAFKEHALDLAQTATSAAPEGGSVVGSLRKEVRWGQVAQLPLGVLYAVCPSRLQPGRLPGRPFRGAGHSEASCASPEAGTGTRQPVGAFAGPPRL